MSAAREIEAQVDAQLLEQGAFAPLELLIDAGRLSNDDYAAWRRGELECLDDALMGSKETIRLQIEIAVDYARRLGLSEQLQEFHAWGADAHERRNALRLSADPHFAALIAGRYCPVPKTLQLDLFFDNPVVALCNGIVRALGARDSSEARRQLDRLYTLAPNHADLAAFDRLLAALSYLEREVDAPRRRLDFLHEITPDAKRLLGFQARDLLTPLWRGLAAALLNAPFSAEAPELHRSFALARAQDWRAVAECVTGEPAWPRHAPLCLLLAQSAFHLRDRAQALEAWFHLCWRSPKLAANVLDEGRQPDTGVTQLWLRFSASAEELSLRSEASEPALTAAEFPAWIVLTEPGLTQRVAGDLAAGETRGEVCFRCVHRWVIARRERRVDDDIALRKVLKDCHPGLFRYLKQCV